MRTDDDRGLGPDERGGVEALASLRKRLASDRVGKACAKPCAGDLQAPRGFQIQYMWAGSRRRYVPDFLVRLSVGKMLALEIKGTDSPQNKAKRDALNEWVKAINASGGFGCWSWDVAFKPGDVQDIITKHTAVAEPVE